ncbi:PAS domain-containing protein [uncultured Shimia sp.]|uniref:PAS domain-containing protein n=1 Tax=uncultured Shimia sp. TaxID=573152 RepID=UPI0025D1045A|nr:PAS domain-containing protein [uncultured Shimia sp.]
MRIFGDGKSSAAKVHSIAVMQDVKAYWDGLRDGHPVPYRSDVDPRQIQKVLKHAFILERIAPGMARLRVSCNTLTDVMGMDMRGMPMSALINEASRDSFGQALEKVFAAPAIGRLEMTTNRGFRRSGLNAEMMLLPLRSDSGEVNRILGAITVDGDLGRAPQRFDLEGSFLRRIDMPSTNALSETMVAPQLQKVEITTPAGFQPAQESAKTPAASRTVPTKHSHLRLVVSDD